ncbi:mannonate dehydratase [Candidatus Latescibacterota bacterium]
MSINRRTFGGSVILGAVGSAVSHYPKAVYSASKSNISNIKLAAQFGPSDETGMALVKSLNLKHLTMWTDLSDENLADVKKQAARLEMNIAYASRCQNWPQIVLNLPGRESAIEEFNRQTIALGKAGIQNRQIYFYTTGVLITHLVDLPGGMKARAFSLNRQPDQSLSYQRFEGLDRTYSEEEIWDNYTYFIRKTAPVAEDANVCMSIHPEDPPGIRYLTEPRVVASSFEGYKRALEIADSPNVGMCLCCGCVLEAGEAWGKDILETIKYFGARNKIFKVHFRNVSSTLPEFHETWLEDGYYDMYQVMKTLREVNNDCIVTVDHWPGNRQEEFDKIGWVRSMTYLKALLERANEEKIL